MLLNVLKDMVARKRPEPAAAAEAPPAATSAQDWLRGIIERMYGAVHRIEPDNFDAERYRGVDPAAFYPAQHASYFSFLIANVDAFHRARGLFADDASRALFDQLVLYRLLGHLHVRLPFHTADYRARLASVEPWRTSDTPDAGAYGPLAIYDVPVGADTIRVKGWAGNVAWTFVFRQYYFERNGVSIQPAAGDCVIDAGGCFGDSALGFAHAVGDQGHVYVFDPLPRHCAIMRDALALNPALAPRITVCPYAVGAHVSDTAPLADDGRIDPGARMREGDMPMTTIDALVEREGLASIGFVKMDVEGSELAALQGAQQALRRFRPKLAISLYHRVEDFFAIPLWIDALGLGYRFHLDHYSIHNEETVLFATA